MSNNELNGPIPDSIGSLTKLRALDLSRNRLEDSIPDIHRLTNLRELYVTLYVGNWLTITFQEH